MKRETIGILMCMLLLVPGACAIAFPDQTPIQDDDTTPPGVWYTLPKKSIFYPLIKPIVVGSTQIWAHASDNESGIDYCELYIDGELQASFSAFPRSWTWSEPCTVLFSKHCIKAVAYDNDGNVGCDEIIVWKFF